MSTWLPLLWSRWKNRSGSPNLMSSLATWNLWHPPRSSGGSADSRSAILLWTRLRYFLDWYWRTAIFFCIDRWQILRVAGTFGHIRHCSGVGCAPPIRESHSCSALLHWAQKALRGSRVVWALTRRRWRRCPAAATGRWMSWHHKLFRNVDRDCSWIFPLLADRDAKIKVQIFVLRKDTANILGMN